MPDLPPVSATYLPVSNSERWVRRLSELRKIPYAEIVALAKFVDDHTLFSTKHGVKGAEFENVIVVAERGWNQYDFNKLLGCWKHRKVSPLTGPHTKGTGTCSMWRALAPRSGSRSCSRKNAALARLDKLFGKGNVQAFNA